MRLTRLAAKSKARSSRLRGARPGDRLRRRAPDRTRRLAFTEMGALLWAAEAESAAASAHREAGRQASARAAAARAALLLEHCGGARTPALAAAGMVEELTPREREIAALAASGASNREIAAGLVVSVRTVENHLQHAYRKLGVDNRRQLPGLLGVVSKAAGRPRTIE